MTDFPIRIPVRTGEARDAARVVRRELVEISNAADRMRARMARAMQATRNELNLTAAELRALEGRMGFVSTASEKMRTRVLRANTSVRRSVVATGRAGTAAYLEIQRAMDATGTAADRMAGRVARSSAQAERNFTRSASRIRREAERTQRSLADLQRFQALPAGRVPLALPPGQQRALPPAVVPLGSRAGRGAPLALPPFQQRLLTAGQPGRAPLVPTRGPGAIDLGSSDFRVLTDRTLGQRIRRTFDTGSAAVQRFGQRVRNAMRSATRSVNVFGSRAERQMRRVDRASRRTTRSLGGMRGAFFGLLALVGGGVGIGGFVNFADTLLQTENRLRVVIDDAGELEGVMDALKVVARDTRTEFRTVAEVYGRLAFNTKDLGTSQTELLAVTRSLAQGIILSGANATEAYTALVQLSQGIASTELRGQELRSVLEQLPFVADVIARGLGVSRGELLRFGEQGKITAAEILRAFRLMREEIEVQFANTIPTIGQAINILRNEFLFFIQEQQESHGILTATAELVLAMANNIDFLARALFALVSAGLLTSLLRFLVAIAGTLTGPAGIIFLITAAGTSFLAFGDQIKVTADGSVSAMDLVRRVGRDLREEFRTLGSDINQSFGAIHLPTTEFRTDLENLILSAAFGFDVVIATLSHFFGTALPQSLQAAVEAVLNFVNRSAQAVGSFINLIAIEFPRSVAQGFLGIFQRFGAVIDRFAGTSLERMSQVAAGFLEVVNTLIDIWLRRVGDFLGGVFGAIGTFIAGLIPQLQRELGGLVGEFQQAFTELAETLTSAQEGFDLVLQLPPSLRNTPLLNYFQQVFGELREGAGRERGQPSSEERPSGAPARTPRGPTFGDIATRLEQENELLRVNQFERERLNAIYDAERQLKRALTTEEETRIRDLITTNQILRGNEAYNEYVATLASENELLRLNTEERERGRLVRALEQQLGVQLVGERRRVVEAIVDENLALQRQSQLYDFLRDPVIAYQRDLADLTAVTARHSDVSRELAEIYQRDLRIAFLDTQVDRRSGFERSLLRIQNAVRDTATAMEQAMSSAFRTMEDAIVQFVSTGRLELNRFVEQIIAAFARIVIQEHLIGPLASIFANAFGGFQAGGAFTSGPTRINLAGGADGGMVVGPGGPRDDRVFARLSPGEFVVNAAATRRHRRTLERINRSRRFQDGGFVGGADTGSRRSYGSGSIRQVNYIDQRSVAPDEPAPTVDVRANGDVLDVIVKDRVDRHIRRGSFDQSFGQRYGAERRLRT